MANSGSFQTNKYGGVRGLQFNWWVNSQSIEGNYTDIGWNFVGYGSNSSTWYYTLNGYLNINGGRVFTQGSSKVQLAVGTVLASGTTRIYHNADGTKSFSADGGATIYNYGTYQTGSGSWSLPTIPRASSVSGGTGNIGSATTINISRASGSFTHTLKYSFGNLSGTIATGVGTSYSWTIPTSFYSQIPNANSGTGTITCETYSGNTLVGTKTCNFTAKVTNSNPVFSSSNLSYQDSNVAITSITGNNQHIVRNQSNLKVSFTGATGKNSASISKYELTFNGSTRTLSSATTVDLGRVNASQNLTLSIKAIDSRGNSTTATKTIIILDWVLPSATYYIKRANNYEDETKIKFNVAISSVNKKNSIQSIQYRYKKVSDTNYSGYTNLVNNTESQISINKLFAWNFQVVIKDKFGTTTYNITVAKGIPIMFIDIALKSVGINCFPTKENSFEVEGYDFENAHPINSIIMTSNNTSPSATIAGTWELLTTQTINGTTIYYWKRTA